MRTVWQQIELWTKYIWWGCGLILAGITISDYIHIRTMPDSAATMPEGTVTTLIIFIIIFFVAALATWGFDVWRLYPQRRRRANPPRRKATGRLKFILKVIGIAVLVTVLLVSLSIILSKQYGINNALNIILSTINVIALVSLAFFTYAYMKSTGIMANEMKTTRELEFELNNRPRVLVKFDILSYGAVYVAVSNVGNGAARNIKMNAVPELKDSRGDSLKRWPAFKDGINYLAPKESLRFFYDTSAALIGDPKLPKSYVVNMEYDWAIEGKPTIHETCPLEVSPYIGTDLASYKDITTLIDEVEKIRKECEKMATELRKRK